MSDLIDRQAAIKAIEQMQMPIMRSEDIGEQFVFRGMSEALNGIKELPSVQPTPFQDWQKIILSNLFVRKGKWIDTTSKDHYKCSLCGTRAAYWFNEENSWEWNEDMSEWLSDFCPNCGARMDSSNE